MWMKLTTASEDQQDGNPVWINFDAFVYMRVRVSEEPDEESVTLLFTGHITTAGPHPKDTSRFCIVVKETPEKIFQMAHDGDFAYDSR